MAAKVMTEIDALLERWQNAGLLSAEAAARIRAHERAMATAPAAPREGKPAARAEAAGMRWQGVTALILGAILLACGVVLFVNAHWSQLSPAGRFALVCAMVAVFHIAGGLAREKYAHLSTALHAVGTIATGAAVALTGQIFNIEEHWPAAILLWALAGFAAWALLGDQAQQTLALLLLPAWMFSEFSYYADPHSGEDAYIGRMLFTWAILYITFFVGSRRRAVQGILFACAAVASIFGICVMLENWTSYGNQTFLPFSLRVWAWVIIAAVPLIVAAFHGHKGLIPIAAAIALALALPWCYRMQSDTYSAGNGQTYTNHYAMPNLLAHALVAAFAVFLCWWGVRLASRLLVNFGIVGFAIAVVWFYFSDLFGKLGRSLGLIGLGILFLAGGWALERTRRRILAGIVPPEQPAASAPARNQEAP
jgi:uncharacterized membrane protein